MKNCLTITVLASLMWLTAGCSTIAVRCPPAEEQRGMPLYGATWFDAMTICTGGGVYAYGDDDNGFGPVFGWLVAVPLSVVDIPVSIVTDTVFVPWDLKRISADKASASEDEWFGYRVASNTQRIRMERRLQR